MPGEDEDLQFEGEGKETPNFGADPVPEPKEDLVFEVDEAKGEAVAVGEGDPDRDEDVTDELADTGKRVEKRIGQLTYRAKEAERVREEAIGYARGVLHENEKLKQRLSGQESSTLSEADERNKSQMAEAKNALKRARDEDDIDAEVEATELISRISADSSNIQRAKRVAARTAGQAQEQQNLPAASSAPAAPAVNVDPKAAEWAQKTEWFGTHEGMTDYAMSQHFEMMKEGFDPHSDEYYNEVETRVHGMFPHMFKKRASASNADNGANSTPGGRSRQTVAPAGNSSGSASKKSKLVVTTSEQAVAQGLGISNEAYAREKARLARERELENA